VPEGQSLTRAGRHSLAISPDGTRIVYVANNQLYLRALDQLGAAQPIRGTANEDPIEPIFSPNGEWVAYWSGAGAFALRKIAVAGGAPLTLCPDTAAPLGATWRHGLIAFGNGSEIQVVPDGGGTPRAIAAVDPKDGRAAQPQLLDDGTHVVFTVFRTTATTEDEGEIVVQSTGGNDRRTLVKGGTNGQLLPTGQLVYIHAGTLLAVPMDMRRLTVTGGPVALVEGVTEALTSGAGQYAVAENGTLAYRPGAADVSRTLVWLDRQGKEQPIPAKPRAYTLPRLSPDGTRVAVASLDEESDVWIWDFEKERLMRLTSGPAVEYSLAWRPDGRQVIFRSAESGKADIFRRSADGSGPVEPVTKDGAGGEVDSVSADGKSLVFKSMGKPGLMLLPLDGGPATPLLKDPAFSFLNGEISPDGRWIAYESNEGGQLHEIYVRPFPAVNTGRSLVSVNGGTMPVWSRSGRELFYRSWSPTTGPKMMAVAISPGASFTYGKPEVLFDMSQYGGPSERIFDVAADGRFLIVKAETNDATNHQTFVVVSHWFDEVRARMPVVK
jgi:serine/threonine-protein kinase